jgi:hypothetical protein
LEIYKKFYVKLKVPLLPRIYKAQEWWRNRVIYWKRMSEKKRILEKKEWKKRAAHIFALLKNMSATPTSLLLIRRSGAPPSLPSLGVPLRSAAQKSAAL